MKRLTLFPHRWKLIALLVLTASITLFIANNFFSFQFDWLTFHQLDSQKGLIVDNNPNLTDEVWLTGIIGSLLILCFSRERIEDEYVKSIRLHAWQWAIVTNYVLFLIAVWTVYGVFEFLGVIIYNVLTPLVIYLIIFYVRLYLLPFLSRRTVV
jgi:hypothetical protein